MIIAGVDVGLKRIGLALLLNGVSIPQNAIFRKNREQASKDLSSFLKEWSVKKIVVGYPLESVDMQKRIKHFINLVNFDGEIIFFDEDFSSFEAQELMKGEIKSKRDGRIDSISAQIILERWLLHSISKK